MTLEAVAIVIVSYNCREALAKCLRSLPPARVVVVDNASRDGSVAMVRENFPEITLIANPENYGFARAVNQGLQATTEPLVLLLNPDAELSLKALSRLIDVMRTNPQVGACGPRLLNVDGSLQPSCRRFPTLGIMAAAELGFRGAYRMQDFAHDQTRPVDQLMGACLLVRREALGKIGGFDERFFLYFEEVDLCLRLAQAGWNVLFVHDAEVLHLGGQSSRTAKRDALKHRYRSLFAFYRKHYPTWQRVVLKCAVQAGSGLRALGGQKDYWSIAKMVWKL